MDRPPPYAPPSDFRGVFRTDRLARTLYAEGAGIARCVPAAVAVPADADDVPALARWAKRTGAPLMPRGSGSGMAAGAVGPGIVVDLSRLRHIAPIDTDGRRVRAGAGALRGEIDAAARAVGLRFPVDPSSGAFCTIGGMVGANAAGARTLRFGATRPWVLGLRCVFDDGHEAWVHRERPLPRDVPAVTRLLRATDEVRQGVDPSRLVHTGVRKESSGYGVAAMLAPGGHLVDLLVGSEGTLALFTEVELALIPVAEATATVLATFRTLEAATVCASATREAGATACELLDRTFLDVAATGGPTGIPADAEAVLLIEVEGASGEDVGGLLDAVIDRCRSHGALALHQASEPDAEHRLWALRHAASPILARLAPRLRSMQFIEDGCVPPEQFPAYVRGVRAALSRFGMPGVIFGHAGDAHAHVNPLVDTSAAGWRDRVHGVLAEVSDLTASLGGTLAGEHGDGRLRAPLLHRVWGLEARSVFAHVKEAADPSGVLNPGCKIARPHDEPFTTLRHDPEAPPLPAEAERVLRDIEQRRDWGRFRLAGVGVDGEQRQR
ncbi:MAG: FAD-binding oxidoreductase [Gemmatimonas sp.]|uniref:FAD-binding oxidoreductase n=1 Tax=Gemmatimonas sp. TaxID=1962908 RepID=UPI00391F58C7|nr:FAD-binding oxidoreductase [Gemmatimonadota bacterium]